MNSRRLYAAIRPYIPAFAVIATGAALVFAIYFTQLELAWVAFLTGILMAAVLSVVTRSAHTEFQIARRTAKLASVQDKNAREIQQRQALETALAAAKARLQYCDDALPVMVAFVDTDGRYQYHNRAFRSCTGLAPEQIDGRPMRDVLGAKTWREIEASVALALSGQAIQYERTQSSPGGGIYRLSVQYLPHIGGNGQFAGFHEILADLTRRGDLSDRAAAGPRAEKPTQAQRGAATEISRTGETGDQDMFLEAFTEQVGGSPAAAVRIIAAIENNQFTLFCQSIMSLAAGPAAPQHYEVLVRLLEEEKSMLPPGAFFPLVEQHGLMPRLDRWVVAEALKWLASRPKGSAVLFINLAAATLADRDFPQYVESQLRESGVPADALCFELRETDFSSQRTDTAEFARLVKQNGCRVALSGFGRDRVSIDMLKHLSVDFLKIDGSVVLGILRDPVDLAKVAAINRVAKAIGIRTVAELVEDDATIAKLREIHIDFAQGFGISRPKPLTDAA